MLEKEFVLKESYFNFNIGDKCRVVEQLDCGCCKDVPLTLFKISDNKNSKYVWMDYHTLSKLIK